VRYDIYIYIYVIRHLRVNDLGICLPVKGICKVRVTIPSYCGACVWAETLTILLFLQNKTKNYKKHSGLDFIVPTITLIETSCAVYIITCLGDVALCFLNQ
jgi:hypothetical protein